MKQPTLKRELGLFHATTIGVGLILGAGIYVLIGQAAETAGNAVWFSFVISAVVALLTGLSYAELSSMYPKDAGEYIYTEKAFGKGLAFFVGYFVLLSGVISAATVAAGFAGYFNALFDFDNAVLVSMLVIVGFSIINYRSIKESAWMNVLFTGLEIIGLLVIIGLGIFYGKDVGLLDMPHGIEGVFKASALVFFAFLGFESVIKLAEEVKNPRRTIPLALLLSIAITTALYLMVAIAAVSVLDWQLLAASSAPLSDVAAMVLGNNAFIAISVIALFSTGNTVLISLVASSRTLYGISAYYKVLKPFNKVHKKRHTPHIAILTVMILAIMFSFIRDVGLIAELTNFTIFVTFAIINLCVITLRFKHPKVERKFKMPVNLGQMPILAFFGFLTCIFFISQIETMVVLGGTGLIVTGVIAYLFILSFEKHSKN